MKLAIVKPCFFRYTGYIQISSIVDLFVTHGCGKPIFENFQHGFRATVFSRQKEKNTENVTENVTENRELIILNLIRENRNITTIQLAKRINVTRRTIARDIENMKQNRTIKRIGSDKAGHWEVIQ